MNGLNIALFGDSIMKGVVLDEQQRRYTISSGNAVKRFTELFHVPIQNYSKFGCTIKTGFQRLSSALHRPCEEENTILIEYGGNDCDFDWDAVCRDPLYNHQPNTTYEDFNRLLNEMIVEAKKAGKKPVLMNLPPIDSELYFDYIAKGDPERARNLLIFLKNKSSIYRQQERYSRAIEKAARQQDILCIDIRDPFLTVRDFSDYLCADGIHPNEKGHTLIEEVFEKTYRQYCMA